MHLLRCLKFYTFAIETCNLSYIDSSAGFEYADAMLLLKGEYVTTVVPLKM